MTTRPKYFVSTESQPRARRPADAVTVALGVVLFAWGYVGVDMVTPWEGSLTAYLTSLPDWGLSLLSFGYLLSFIYGLGVLVAILAGGRRRRAAIRDVVLATTLAGTLATALTLIVDGAWPYIFPELGLDDPTPRFPVLRVVLVTAVLISSAPHLSRPMRRLGWLMILWSAAAAVALSYGHPSDTIGGVGIGLITGGAVLLIFGSPRGYPDPASVGTALRAMGLDIGDPAIDPRQSWGVRRLTATTGDGVPITIKAYGRDATDSQLMSKAWRTLIYREQGPTIGSSRLQAVEHEALVTMMAGATGAPVPRVAAVGQSSSEIALLALQVDGSLLGDLEPQVIDDRTLVDIWRDIGRLHVENISHGSLDTSAIVISPTGHVITDFALGSLVANEVERAHDIVELLFSLSLLVGTSRAVETCVGGLGNDRLVAVLPYLQLPAVATKTRHDADKPKDTIKAIQEAAVAITGESLPEPAKLRRVSGRNLLMTALVVLAAWALIPLFTQVDYSEVWNVLEGADWALMAIALLVGQSYFLAQASATSFAVARPVPFWPLTILQVAAKFIGLAIPSAAGRVAMNAAFLQKYGLTLTEAVVQGSIDGFTGFLVQVVILVIALFAGDLTVDTSSLDLDWGFILIVVVLLVVSVVYIVLKVRRVRDRVMPVINQAWGSISVVLRQPTRAFGLLASNLWYWVTLGTTLWLILTAVGVQMSFFAALVVAVATDLLGGFVPIPGGVGVSEAVMTGFLAALGVDQSTAFAATIAYRGITFYLAAGEGFLAFKWLERNEYI